MVAGGFSRRRFVAGAAAALLARGTGRAAPSQASPLADEPLPRLPSGVDARWDRFENWSKEIRAESVLTCVPRSRGAVVELVQWAADNGFRVRPSGSRHGWSPLSVSPDGTDVDRTVLVELSALKSIAVHEGAEPTVTVGAAVTMDELLAALAAHGLGLPSVPAVGDVTVGGVLAIGGHGANLAAGSLSDRLIGATIVGHQHGRYRPLHVSDPDPRLPAIRVALGRTLLLDATLRVEANRRLRCLSDMSIPASELFAAPHLAGPRSMGAALARTGQAEAIWFPFTERPWFKVWSDTPTQPVGSRRVDRPYNYAFSDSIPATVSDLATALVTGNAAATPTFGRLSYSVSRAGLMATNASDLWGWARNLQLYIRPTTLRGATNGYAVLTTRAGIQDTIHRVAAHYQSMLTEARAEGRFPNNLALELRASGLDRGGVSALAPSADGTADCALWVNMLTLTGTPGAHDLRTGFERWLVAEFPGRVRPEWSKGFGYSPDGPWTDDTILAAARRTYPDWDHTVGTWGRLDPAGVFASPYLDRVTSI